jgi:hypothetical protein
MKEQMDGKKTSLTFKNQRLKLCLRLQNHWDSDFSKEIIQLIDDTQSWQAILKEGYARLA